MKRKKRVFVWCLFIILCFALLFFLLMFVTWLDSSKQAFEEYRNSLPNYNNSSVLVFKEVSFYKYIVFGKPTGTNEHLDSLRVYLFKGKADYGFDLSSVYFDDEKTDILQRRLVINFKSKSFFPVFVDVQIPAVGVKEISAIDPTPVSQLEAEKTAKAVGSLGGVAGSLFGGIIGSGFSMTPVQKIIGGVTGGVIGGAGLGIPSYLMTKNFLLEFEVSGITATDRENLIDSAKPLIALELLDGQETVIDEKSLEEWQQAIIEKYEQEIVKALTDFFKPFGWKKVEVNFTAGEIK